MTDTRKEALSCIKKILIKVGSGVLTRKDGLDMAIIELLVEEIAQLRSDGYQVVMVTSGAIASGRHRLGLGKLKSMPEKQAAAAIGQGRLMRVYSNLFGKHKLYVAQILLTMSDLIDRRRFINVRNTLSKLLEWGIIPIVNENDTVAVDEIKFGDNDQLAAMMANIMETDLVINLTNTEGLYDRNPSLGKRAKLLKLVEHITPEIENAATAEADPVGMGGMKSKVLAAKKITACGIPYIIASGKRKGVLGEIMAGKETGTLFLPIENSLSSREYWIAFTLRSRGKLYLDDGAKSAIIKKGCSLLPSGIVKVEGEFKIGDPVICFDLEGKLLAKGLVNYSANEIRKIQGLKTSKIEQVLGYKYYDEVIHRDNMAVTREEVG
ncbi:MAG: glutamate 5-kinase [Syntrophaceae bacterium]